MRLSSLDDLIHISKSKKEIRIVVAAAADELVLSAINKAYVLGLIKPLLVGNAEKISVICSKESYDSSLWVIIDEKDAATAASIAVSMIKKGKAEILMKGMVSTAPLLKAILDKEKGIRNCNVLSHFALFQSSYYHKLFGITDAAMNIYPQLKEKKCIIENAVKIFHKLGNMLPKVAVLSPLEMVNEKIQSTIDAISLKEMQKNNLIPGCLIDGPFALDIAVSKKAAVYKSVISDVAGDADILLVPDLNSGNIFYKSLIFLSDGISASIITGADSPIVLTSRADSDSSKLYSIALATALI